MNLSAESRRELERLVKQLWHAPESEVREVMSELLTKLARTEVERDELRREAEAEAREADRWHTRTDEARRRAEELRDILDQSVPEDDDAKYGLLPWELGAPAAGREEGAK